MTTDETSSKDRTEPDASGDTQELRDHVAQTRVELGDTVAALAAKVDLKARAQRTAAQAKAKGGEQIGQAARSAKEAVSTAGEQVRDKAGQLTAKAREVASSDETAPPAAARRSGALAAIVAVAGVVAVAMWMLRRRNARKRTRRWWSR